MPVLVLQPLAGQGGAPGRGPDQEPPGAAVGRRQHLRGIAGHDDVEHRRRVGVLEAFAERADAQEAATPAPSAPRTGTSVTSRFSCSTRKLE